jgi:L,D-transpeptidase catalytic domain
LIARHFSNQGDRSGCPIGCIFMRSAPLLSASLLAAALAVALAVALAAPAHAAIVVNIDKSTQQMSVSVDGAERYVWPVSTGRAGYDTPNGTFKANRMDAEHLSQEWDNAPMPHTIFFDLHGHAIHGFFDVKHLGMPVSHGCVRISPDHAATLFELVRAEGMSQTTVVVSGQTPVGASPAIARRRAPIEEASGQPLEIAPNDGGYQPRPPQPYDGQGYQQPQPRPYYAQTPQPYYGPPQQPAYGQQQYYRQQPQPYYGQQQPYYGQAVPPQPPPVQYYVVRPYGQY